MTRPFLFLFSFFFFLTAQAQYTDPDIGGHGLIKTKPKVLDVEGSPYLQENFTSGYIVFDGKDPVGAFLRLNVLEEEMEIKVDQLSQDIYTLPSEGNFYYKIGDRDYSKRNITYDGNKIFGFFGVSHEGEKVSFLVKPTAKVSEPVFAKTGYHSDKPGEITIEEEYYLVFADGRTENVRLKHRDIKKVFDSSEAKDYLSDNKIRSEQDLVEFLRFYEELD